MVINIENTAAQNLIALINQQNGTSVTSAEITLGTPVTWTDPEAIDPQNTQIDVSATPGGGYVGTINFEYTRLDLDVINSAQNLSYELSDTSTVESIRDAAATQLGVIMAQCIITDDQGTELVEVPTVNAGETATVYLTAIDTSFTYIGTTAVTVNPNPNAEVQMADAFSTTRMTGFSYA